MTLRFPHTCDEAVTRGHHLEACAKPAVAIAHDREFGGVYPVCKHHARGREMVTLAELFEALGVQE